MKDLKSQIPDLKSPRGFTILEVIVAIAIIGICLVVIMDLFSGALRSGRLSNDYTEAFIYATAKMEESLLDPKEGSATGRFNDYYRWQREVTLLNDRDREKGIRTEESEWQTYEIKVKVLFPGLGGEKSIELVTLKTIPSEK